MKDASFVPYKYLNDTAKRYLEEHSVPVTGLKQKHKIKP